MLLICGEALFDLFTTGDAAGALSFSARMGGSPYNVAVGLARLGTKVAFLAGISTDFLGEKLRQSLEAEGVSTDFLVPRKERTTLSLVMLDTAGVPHYSFYGDGAADRALTPAAIPALEDNITGLHFGSFSLMCEPTATTLLRLAEKAAGRLVSLDPNVRLNVVPDIQAWRARLDQWLRLAHVVKVSLEDLETLYPATDPIAVARDWLEKGASVVVVTRGGDGCIAVTSRFEIVEPAPIVTVVDTVGAGDSFQAALLHQLAARGCRHAEHLEALGREALQEMLAFATMAGALTCESAGADLPNLDAVRIAVGRGRQIPNR
jgi:fructokinase